MNIDAEAMTFDNSSNERCPVKWITFFSDESILLEDHISSPTITKSKLLFSFLNNSKASINLFKFLRGCKDPTNKKKGFPLAYLCLKTCFSSSVIGLKFSETPFQATCILLDEME